MNRILAAVAAAAALAAPARAGQEAPGPDGVEFFEKRIRPALARHCYPCHSERAEKLKGELKLDSREAILKGGTLGPAVVPGDPDRSLLLRALRWTDDDLKMPPRKKLPAEAVADFEAWIRQGAPAPSAGGPAAKAAPDLAEGRNWWAFRPPADVLPPDVTDAAWVRHPVDRFILSKLEGRGLRPAPPADKRTLLRRVTFDLVGLPPAPGEIEAFLADDAPDAFDRVVERLLRSPHYGERWGRHWLDVVRYADSNDARGMFGPKDIGEAWRYRDWVVDAFNRDVPYDAFVRLQIAGDLLPAPGGGFPAEGLLATGVFAIGTWGNGDADKEKQLTDIVDDQVDVLGRAFLGLTLACARCHDHKFDPILQEDYYGLAGFFFSSHILPNPGPKTDGSDILRIPLAPRERVEARQRHEADIAALEKKLGRETDGAWAALAKELLGRTPELLRAVAEYERLPEPPPPAEFAARKGVPAFALRAWRSYLGTGELGLLTRASRDVHGKKGVHAWSNANGADTPSAVVNTTDGETAFLTLRMPPRAVAIHPSPEAGVAAGWKSPLSGKVRVSGLVQDADAVGGDGVEWTLDLVSGGTSALARGAIANGGREEIAGRVLDVREGDLLQLAVLPKREYTCDTTVVELSVTEEEGPRRSWVLSRDVVQGARAGSPANPMGAWCFYDLSRKPGATALDPSSALARWTASGRSDEAADAVGKALLAPGAAQGPDAKLLRDLTDPKGPFLGAARQDDGILPPGARAALSRMRGDLARLKETLPPPIPACHGLQEGGCPQTPYAGFHDARVHIRGRYDRLGAVVPRRFPRVLAGDAPAPVREGSGRLELARWAASAENPLAARVMVNRIWQHHFGEGLVRTPNNFGRLGERPTHPELLDFLAREFVRSGWSVKAMHRALLLSSTYRQSSVPEPAALRADPANALFGRMNRRRLSAEELRDSLLAVSGALDRTLGGPSVRDLAGGRRTLYLTTVRSDRNTYRMLFDAADPGVIVERRADSTVAPQALFLLNHPFVLARSRGLAERVARRPGDEAAKVRWLYEVLYGRPPGDREERLGRAVLSRTREAERAAGNGARPEDVWEPYCQVLLCANEFMYVD